MKEDREIYTTANRAVTVGPHVFGPNIVGFLAIRETCREGADPDDALEHVSAGLTREECLAIGTALLELAMGVKS